MFDKIDQYVAAVVSSRQDILASGIYLNHREAIPRIIEKIMTDPNIMEISIFDADGAPFYLTHPDNHKETRIHDEDATIRNPEITFSVLQEHFQGVRVRTYTFPLTVIDEPAGIFRLRYTVDTVFREAMLGILLFISLILTILVFLFILIYFAVTRFVVLPIEEMIRTLRRASDGELGEQVTIILNNEIGELATIFNIMSAKNAKMMTALRDTNRELKTARNYLHNIINSMPSALIGVDIDGRVTQWNVIAEKLTGTASSDARGKSLQTVFPRMATQLNIIQESIQTRKIRTAPKKPCQFDNHIRYEDITIYPLVANGVDGAVIRIDDITEKVRMEEMMIQSERMLSLGGLAAGMAHEINNPLSGMIQNAQVISNRLMDHIDMPANQKAALAQGLDIPAIGRFLVARKIPELVLGIIASGHRVSEIINNMLSFVRKTEGSFSSHSLEELCEKTLVLAASDFNTKKKYDFRKIQIFKSYGDPVPHVLCEASKIQQVLLNIFINGAYAMKTASTENPGFHVSTFFDDSRKMACLEIRDNGPGMDEPTRKRIFEPFFTTKPEGIGTGLGLSVSYFIITEYHLGDISVESAPGSGAAFLIRLPAVTPQTR